MAVIGNIGAFDEKIEQFEDYADRCDAFMAANSVEPNKQANLFLAIVGADTFKLLKSLCSPETPKSKSYDDLKTLLTEHYSPAPILIAERHNFWTASQGEHECVADFVVRLKRLASTCQFGTFLTEFLRDRLVFGLHRRMSRTQTYLLSKRDLTFDIAKAKCVAEELAGKASTAHMGSQAASSDGATNRIQGRRHAQGRRQPRERTPDRPSTQGTQCKCCGGSNHRTEKCRFKDSTCYRCQKKGHIRKMCLSSVDSNSRNKFKFGKNATKYVDSSVTETGGDSKPKDDDCDQYGLYSNDCASSDINSHSGKVKPIKLNVNVGDVNVFMELDTGASRSTISESVYREKLANFSLYNSKIVLHSYTGEQVPIVGCILVPVRYDGNPEVTLELIVVKGNRPSLFGRDWLSKIKLDWQSIFSINEVSKHEVTVPQSGKFPPEFNALLKQNSSLFSGEGMGIKGFTASLKLKPEAKPVFQKARAIPYALVEKAENEYDRLIKTNVLYPIECSNWASPAVHVLKPNDKIRVCGDYKGVNEVIEDDNYKLPNIQDLFAKLTQNGTQPKVFSKLDLTGAFNQLYLDEDSAKLLALNTQRGLLATKRLCFGVKTAPSQFQATMDKILAGLDNVLCYIDDIFVATETKADQVKVLKKVFERLTKYNVRLNGDKCKFFQSEIEYLGHLMCADGIRPVQSKIQAIENAPRPKDVSELKSFLGILNYYGKFVPNLSTNLQPLYHLLNFSTKWVWSEKCEEAFRFAKNFLAGDKVLLHYDPKKPLILSVDASPYGVGAVLSHRLKDGTERPIAYASRTLSAAEKNYAQIEKEGLAIVYGIKKFHLYLFGRKFLLVTDHQPLTHIFGPKSGIPSMAAARLQRWAILLSGYSYEFVYRSSEQNANADMLSRFPVDSPNTADLDGNFIFQTTVDSLPITAMRIAESTKTDTILAKVYEYTMSGWSNYCTDKAIQPYWNRRHELSVDDGCLLWGRRVIIPPSLQHCMLSELHEDHPGMCRMKALARSFVWWPCLDSDIEEKVRTCSDCIELQGSPKQAPLLLWPWATEPWQRIHMDFAEIKGQHFLIVVDSFSKWLEVFPMSSTTTTVTISVLRALFARYGLPQRIVSDNGPHFISEEFKTFLKCNGIEHTLCPPYHPSSNGLAEKNVQTCKHMFKKSDKSLTLQHRVAKILLNYRNIPHTTTGLTPAEMFLKRTPRTRLSMVKPCLQRKVENKQNASKVYRDGSNPRPRSFDLYQPVRVRNTRGGREKWIPGTIVEIKGPLTYLVRVPGNSRRFVHADHLIADDTVQNRDESLNERAELEFEQVREIPVTPRNTHSNDATAESKSAMPTVNPNIQFDLEIPNKSKDSVSKSNKGLQTTAPDLSGNVSIVPNVLRRSNRVIRPPEKLDL